MIAVSGRGTLTRDSQTLRLVASECPQARDTPAACSGYPGPAGAITQESTSQVQQRR
jgi:hypothetical protein